MAVGKGRQGDFQRLLDVIGDRHTTGNRILAAAGDARLWPRCAETPERRISAAGAVVAAYAANEQTDQTAAAPAHPERLPLAPAFVRIRGELDSDLRVEDLRRLRRRCAFLVHPDRTPAIDRARAENFLAEINAAIDQAIKDKSPGGRHR